jgi:hypothetical protein
MKTQQTRAPHHIGRFGESFVTYALIRRGFEVATVDHVGADLISERDGERLAISVKTRLFREGSVESKMLVIEESGLERLCIFSEQFAMIPMIAYVVCLSSEKKIHLFLMSVEHVRKNFKRSKFGYSLYFSESSISQHIDDPDVAYACWHEQNLERFERRANQSLQTMTTAVTDRAPSSTLRASCGHV